MTINLSALRRKLRTLFCEHAISFDQVYRRTDGRAECLCRHCDKPITADHGYQLAAKWVPPARPDWHLFKPRRAALAPFVEGGTR